MTTVDPYGWWREAIKGNFGPVVESAPQCGRYKMRRVKSGPWLACAIFESGCALKAAVGKEPANPHEIWTHVAKHPVSEDAYRFAMKHGRFPDEPEALPQRSNMPADPVLAMQAEIEDRARQAEEWLAAHPQISSQVECDLAANMQSQLLGLFKMADGAREIEKRPHLLTCKAIDDRFRPLTTLAKTWADKLRLAFEPYLKAEQKRREAEALRKFEAERAAAQAERERIETERAVKLRDDPVAAYTEAPPAMPELPLAPDRVRVTAGGAVGRKRSLRTERVHILSDAAATFAFLMGTPHRDEIEALLLKCAKKVMAANQAVPGITVEQDQRAA